MQTAQKLSWTQPHYALLALIILLTGAAQIYLFKQQFYSISADESGGIFLNTLALKGTDKILIDTGTWSYVNLIVASNIPERFIKNTGPDPLYKKPGVVDAKKGIDELILKKNGD